MTESVGQFHSIKHMPPVWSDVDQEYSTDQIQPNIRADPNLTQGLLPESTRNLLFTNLSATCGFYFKINSGLTLDFFGVSFLGSL